MSKNTLSDPFGNGIVNVCDCDLLSCRDLSQRPNADTGSFKRYIRIRFAGMIHYADERIDGDAEEFMFDYRVERHAVQFHL